MHPASPSFAGRFATCLIQFAASAARWAGVLAVCAAAVAVTSVHARAQDSNVVLTAAQFDQLLKRIDALENEVKELRAAKPAAPQPVATAAAAPIAPVAPAPAASGAETPADSDRYPRIAFHLTGDVTYTMTNAPHEHDTFGLGDLDPMVDIRFSDHTGLLGDFVVASNHGEFAFEVERLIAQYKVSDALNVDVGHFHTAIGYYNNTFHNGTYFQTTTNRPDVYEFEDNGGILPVHSNGVSLTGDIAAVPALGLRYAAELANGRDYSPDHGPFSVEDDNRFKAFNVALSSHPDALPGTVFGVSAYHDSVTVAGLPRVDQSIFSAYAVYKARGLEWINEGLLMRDQPLRESTYNTRVFYTQISQKFGAFRPYVRLEWRRAASEDPLLALIEQDVNERIETAGVRYDFTPMMALKGEYKHESRAEEANVDEGTVQLSFRY